MATDNIFSGLWARRVLNHFNGTTTLAAPGQLYVALLFGFGSNTAGLPDLDDNTGANTLTAFQVQGTGSGGYATGTTVLPSVNFGSVTTGTVTGANPTTNKQEMSNTNAVSFNIGGLGGGGSANVRGIAIVNSNTIVGSYDTSFAGNGSVIWFGDVASPINVSNGNTLTFAIGQITIRLG